MRKVYIGADHRGFQLKKKVAEWLAKMAHDFDDMGAHDYDPDDDYTVYAARVASVVADNQGMGIIMCGSGVGVDVTANKFDGVRASIGKEPAQVSAGRKDDDMNVLVLAADYTDELDALAMVEAFLETHFEGKPRHKRRLRDIEKIEANN